MRAVFAEQARHMGWWENQHGNQLRISGTATFASSLLTVMSAAQLMFLQDNADFQEYTGASIVLIVIGVIGLAVSELRKLKGDGDEAARILGGGHQETWNSFLQEKGLKKR